MQKGEVRTKLASHVRRVYMVTRSIRRTAKIIGTSYGTVREALKDTGGVPKLERSYIRPRSGPGENSRISEWLHDHKDRRIPRNYSTLSLASGATVDSIKCYFYRKRKALKARLLAIPSLRDERIALIDIDERIISGSDILSYEYHVDRMTLEVTIIAKLRDGSISTVSVQELKPFITSVQEALSR
jgi:hypothetical protein